MHNRLKLMRVYLVGPMDHDREAGKPWRIEMANWLKTKKAIPIDPYNKPLLPINKQGLEEEETYKEVKKAIGNNDWDRVRELMKPIVHTDLRIVDHCDCIIANLDKDKAPCGSFDEIFTAANQNKPVIVHCPQGKNKIYNWMWGRLPHELFFDTWDQVKEYLTHIDEDSDDKINLLNRWKFFDLEPVIREVLNNSI